MRWWTIADTRPPIAIALGDPAGIGPEIVGKSWAMRDEAGLAPFFAVGDAGSIGHAWSGPVARIASPEEASSIFSSALPVMHVMDCGPIQLGRPDRWRVPGVRWSRSNSRLA